MTITTLRRKAVCEKLGVLHHLGMEGGRLRTDVWHQWQDRGALDDSGLALSLLQTNNQPVWLWRLCVAMVVTVWCCALCYHIQLTANAVKGNRDASTAPKGRLQTI